MFLGTHTPRLDEKGRLFLPARFREELGQGVVVTKGQDRCLLVFPRAEFERRSQALQEAPVSDRRARALARVIFGSAYDEVPDKQGRITIPAGLREWAGLQRDVVVVGAGRRVEIWDAVAWSSYETDEADAFAGELEEGAGFF